MLVLNAIIGLVLLAFLLNQNYTSSEVIVTVLVLVVLFFCVLHTYYGNVESAPQDLYNEETKKLKKKQHLNEAFDAILNKNTSSSE